MVDRDAEPLIHRHTAHAACGDSSAYTFDALTRVKPIDAVVDEDYVAERVQERDREGVGEGEDGLLVEGGEEGLKSHGLAKKLTVYDLIAFGVGTTVGAGVYSLIGVGSLVAGPAILLSFLVGAVSCALTGLAYSEFAARCPVSGSAYTYAYTSFGEGLAWVIGWNLTLEYAISAAAIARSWGDYVSKVADLVHEANGGKGHALPRWLHGLPLGGEGSPFSLSVLAAFVVLACSGVMLFGVQESTRFNMVVTSVNLVVLLFVVIAGSFYVKSSNWTIENDSYVPYGGASVLAGAGTVFFSYIGFDMVSSLAEEVRNPQRDMPVGIITSLGISAGVYVAVSLVVTGMVSFLAMGEAPAPLAFAFESVGLKWASWVVSCGSLFGLTAATFTCLLGQPRIFYRMAHDGLLFPLFGQVDKRGTPVAGTLITGALTAAIALFVSLEALAEAISVGTLLAFTLVDAGVITLRLGGDPKPRRYILTLLFLFSLLFFLATLGLHLHWSYYLIGTLAVLSLIPAALIFRIPTKPENIPTTFQCPFVPAVPLAGMAVNIAMLSGLGPDAWLRLAIWTLVGAAIYFAYGIRHSVLRNLPNLIPTEQSIQSPSGISLAEK